MRRIMWFTIFVLAATVVLCIMSSCRTAAPARPVAVAAAPCAGLPPIPDIVPVIVAGSEDGCPSPFVACLDASGVVALSINLHVMQGWIREAWARCGATDSVPEIRESREPASPRPPAQHPPTPHKKTGDGLSVPH